MNEVISEQSLKPILSSQLRRLRERAGMSQGHLADAVGVTRATINRIEQGHILPRSELLFSLADALGVPSDAFRQITEISKKLAATA